LTTSHEDDHDQVINGAVGYRKTLPVEILAFKDARIGNLAAKTDQICPKRREEDKRDER